MRKSIKSILLTNNITEKRFLLSPLSLSLQNIPQQLSNNGDRQDMDVNEHER